MNFASSIKFGRGEQQPQTRNLPFCSPSPKITADATLREGGRGQGKGARRLFNPGQTTQLIALALDFASLMTGSRSQGLRLRSIHLSARQLFDKERERDCR